MVAPLHLGHVHPNMLWIAGTAFFGFIAGYITKFYRSHEQSDTNISHDISDNEAE